jgi:hypothetical protein
MCDLITNVALCYERARRENCRCDMCITEFIGNKAVNYSPLCDKMVFCEINNYFSSVISTNFLLYRQIYNVNATSMCSTRTRQVFHKCDING